MIGEYFIYNGKSSEEYGLMFLNKDTEENKEVGGVIEYTTFKHNKSPNYIIQDINYNSYFEFEIEAISEKPLDEDIDSIYNWLLSQPDYKKLYVGDDEYYYYCIFTNSSFIKAYGPEGYGIYGIKATMQCDSMFMWKDVTNTYSNEELIETIVENNTSAVKEYTYPNLVIHVGGTGGDITVQNISENRLIKIHSALVGDIITINSFPCYISSYLNDNDVMVYENFNKQFPRLLQGENRIGIVGDIDQITLSYKVGRLVR